MNDPSLNEEDNIVEEAARNYKVGEKKSLQEYVALDAEDESLRRWKESLGILPPSGESNDDIALDPSDARRVIIISLTLHSEGNEPQVFDFQNSQVIQKQQKEQISVRENTKYHLSVKFRVQHEIVTNLKYIMTVKKKGVRVNMTSDILGSYAPSNAEMPFREIHLEEEQAPSGFLGRGLYRVSTKFTDDDKNEYLSYDWDLTIHR